MSLFGCEEGLQELLAVIPCGLGGDKDRFSKTCQGLGVLRKGGPMCFPILKVHRGEGPVLVTPLPHQREGKSLGDLRAVRPLWCPVAAIS